MKIYALATFFLYFSLGAFFPLLSEYLVKTGLTGTQIGSIFSIGTFMTIFFQPLWGFIADKTGKKREILFVLAFVTAIIVFSFPFAKVFLLVLVVFALTQAFICGLFPINDAMILHSKYKYGSIRLWGAIGFAVAAQISAFLSDHVSKYMIFVCTGLALLTSIIFIMKMEVSSEQSEPMDLKLLKDLFKNKDYLFFLLVGFFIGGTINAHNSFFGLLYIELGGAVTGIGTAFLLFALSEAPFLRLSTFFIRKIGLNTYLLISAILFCLRWMFYGFAPSYQIILITFVIQGLSLGSFLAGTAEYLNYHTKKAQTATAITFYNSASIGIGSMSCIFISGKIMDAYSVAAVYKFYSVWTMFGIILLVVLVLKERKLRFSNKTV